MERKNGFVMYKDWCKPVEMLDDAAAGKLLKAIYRFHDTGEAGAEDLPLNAQMLFCIMAGAFERDNEKYLERCRKNRENALKRSQPDFSD